MPVMIDGYTWIDGYAGMDWTAAEKAVQLIMDGHSLRGAAGGIGITYSSLLRWITQYPEFARMVDKASAKKVHQVESLIFTEIHPVRHKTQLTLLQRAAPEAWDSSTPPAKSEEQPEIVQITFIQPEPQVLSKNPIIQETSTERAPEDKTKIN